MSENNKPTSQSELRDLIGDIAPLAQNKEYTELDKFAAGFINLSRLRSSDLLAKTVMWMSRRAVTRPGL